MITKLLEHFKQHLLLNFIKSIFGIITVVLICLIFN